MTTHELHGSCICRARYEAMRRGELLYVHARCGWIMTDMPLRYRAKGAQSLAAIHDVDDHTGEPYTLDVCPFCGHELPVWVPNDDEVC